MLGKKEDVPVSFSPGAGVGAVMRVSLMGRVSHCVGQVEWSRRTRHRETHLAGILTSMEIEILHIAECPNVHEAGERVMAVLADLGASEVPVRFTLISTSEQAAQVPFSGSPTVLIDGADAFPSNGRTHDLACRVYQIGNRFAGTPSLADLRDVLAHKLGLQS